MFNCNSWKLDKTNKSDKDIKLKQNYNNESHKMSFLSVKRLDQKVDFPSKQKGQSENKELQKVRDFFGLDTPVIPDSTIKEINQYDWFMSRNNLYIIELLSKNKMHRKKNKHKESNFIKNKFNSGLLGFSFEKNIANPFLDPKRIIPKSSSVKQIGVLNQPQHPLTPTKRKSAGGGGGIVKEEEDDNRDKERDNKNKSNDNIKDVKDSNDRDDKEQDKDRTDKEVDKDLINAKLMRRTNSPQTKPLKIKKYELPPMSIFKPLLNMSLPYDNFLSHEYKHNHKHKHIHRLEAKLKICYQHSFYFLSNKLDAELPSSSTDLIRTSKINRHKWASFSKNSTTTAYIPSFLKKTASSPKALKPFIQPMNITNEKIDSLFKTTIVPLSKNKLLNTSFTFNYNISGNYRNQFIQYFTHRINWRHVFKEDNKLYNFQWKYSPCKLDFKKYKYDSKYSQEQLQTINVFERFFEIGNKNFLFINMFNYCKENKINVFDILPMTAIISNGIKFDSTLKALEELMGLFEKNAKTMDVMVNNNKTTNESSALPEGVFLRTLYKDVFDFEKCFAGAEQSHIYIPYSYTSEKNYWIIKPVDLYQGKCIHITNDIFEIRKFCNMLFKGIDKRFKADNSDIMHSAITPSLFGNLNNSNSAIKTNLNNSNDRIDNVNNCNVNNANNGNSNVEYTKKKRSTRYCTTNVVIQKYLDQPMLYNKRKFDIRCYVLVDCNLNVYYCREGHLKGCSEEYDINNLNHFVHITNYSLQKYSANFEKYEIGNEVSYQSLRDFLQAEGHPEGVFDECLKKMKLLIKISMKSVGEKFFKHPNVLSFQIFGYDFILDNNFHPWILEVNDNPGLSISSPVIAKLIPRMVDDAFRLTIDKIFETKYADECVDKETMEYKSPYQLDGYSDRENVFEFVCNIK